MVKSKPFAFGTEAALRAVADANAGRAADVRRLLAARDQVPERLTTKEEVGRASASRPSC